MKKVLFLCSILSIFILTGSAGASIIYEDENSNGFYDAGEDFFGGTNGDGGATYNLAFDLVTVDDFGSISMDFLTYDQNFVVEINGTTVVPLDPGNPAVFAPAIGQPWRQNDHGLPRLSMEIFQNSVIFSGTQSQTSTEMTVELDYRQPTYAFGLLEGQNLLKIINPDADGPDGLNFEIEYVAPVPEPATMILFGIGLLGLAGVSRKKLR